MELVSEPTQEGGTVPRPATERIWIAGTLDRGELTGLARRGVRVVVDLRATGEPVRRGLCPASEQVAARELGLEYHQVPVTAGPDGREALLRVRAILSTTSDPVVLHCATGRRAAVFASAHVACTRGWSVARCMAHVRELGFDLTEMPPLQRLLCSYVERHGRESRDQRRCPHGAWL